MYLVDSRPLSEVADEIENSLVEMYATQLREKDRLGLAKQDCYQRYRLASEDGDRRENAPLEEAIRDMRATNVSIRICEEQLSRLKNIDDLTFREKVHSRGDTNSIEGLRAYNSTGMVALYATVSVEKLPFAGEESERFIFRIYPDDISYPDVGVMAANTNLATALMGKSVGDEAVVSSGPYQIHYKILDVY